LLLFAVIAKSWALRVAVYAPSFQPLFVPACLPACLPAAALKLK